MQKDGKRATRITDILQLDDQALTLSEIEAIVGNDRVRLASGETYRAAATTGSASP